MFMSTDRLKLKAKKTVSTSFLNLLSVGWMLLMFLFPVLKSQQAPLYTQYMLNGMILNPAFTGTGEYTTLNMTFREQWAGFEKPPRTLWANFQTPLTGSKVGLGGCLYTDRDGLVNNTGGVFSYAYHLMFKKSKLSFGISASFYQIMVNRSDVKLTDMNEPLFYDNKSRLFSPDANFGALYQTKDFFAGLSVNQLLESGLKINKTDLASYKQYRHYYLMGGVFIKASNTLTVQPSILIKTPENNSFQGDISVRTIFNRMFWTGLTYRTNKDIIYFMGTDYKKFIIGYAFDYPLTNLRRQNFGSHELSVTMKFGTSALRLRQTGVY